MRHAWRCYYFDRPCNVSSGFISAITTALAEQNINVHNMQNASKGDYAYTLLDVETVFDGIEDKLIAVDGIIRVRVIK